MSDFAEAKANFGFLAYAEFLEKSTDFDDWWKDHVESLFASPVHDVLEKIALPPPPKKAQSSNAETTSATTSTKPGHEKEVQQQKPSKKSKQASPSAVVTEKVRIGVGLCWPFVIAVTLGFLHMLLSSFQGATTKSPDQEES